jgi:hypothetical protein
MSTQTTVRFEGGPLAGTQRAKTSTGRPPLYLTTEGDSLLTAKGDRIRAAEGVERSPRAAVTSCYLKASDAYDTNGRRVITYRFITMERAAS